MRRLHQVLETLMVLPEHAVVAVHATDWDRLSSSLSGNYVATAVGKLFYLA